MQNYQSKMQSFIVLIVCVAAALALPDYRYTNEDQRNFQYVTAKSPLCQGVRPPLPKNSRIRCSLSSDSSTCLSRCLDKYTFPNGQSELELTCVDNQWKLQGEEWAPVPVACEPTCGQGCQNGGKCISANVCQCPSKFRGDQCQYSTDRCTINGLGFNGAVRCRGDSDSLSCAISCPVGVQMTHPPAAVYTCKYETGRFSPQPVPQCNYPTYWN